MTPKIAIILGGCINMMFMFGSILPTFCLDRMGRRKTMFWGCTGLGLSMMMIAILLSFQGTSVGQATASASVAFFFTVRIPSLCKYLCLLRPHETNLPTVHVNFRRQRQLCPLGLRP
jgi:hypothetical protein